MWATVGGCASKAGLRCSASRTLLSDGTQPAWRPLRNRPGWPTGHGRFRRRCSRQPLADLRLV